ncbi:hypothetical protein EDC32_1011209 [Laceyella sacchari]|nr:hypothetical protein EDC32_1011209 [Laceyella sacchari]
MSAILVKGVPFLLIKRWALLSLAVAVVGLTGCSSFSFGDGTTIAPGQATKQIVEIVEKAERVLQENPQNTYRLEGNGFYATAAADFAQNKMHISGLDEGMQIPLEGYVSGNDVYEKVMVTSEAKWYSYAAMDLPYIVQIYPLPGYLPHLPRYLAYTKKYSGDIELTDDGNVFRLEWKAPETERLALQERLRKLEAYSLFPNEENPAPTDIELMEMRQKLTIDKKTYQVKEIWMETYYPENKIDMKMTWKKAGANQVDVPDNVKNEAKQIK